MDASETSRIRLRAHGCLLGQVVGDALGAVVEFQTACGLARRYPKGLRQMVASPVWNTLPGQITDDTELALALAAALDASSQGPYDPDRAAAAYGRWLSSGPFDVGGTIGRALNAVIRRDASLSPAEAARRAASRVSQANGALMRISPMAVWGLRLTAEELDEAARQDAALTHPHQVCRDASAVFVVALREAIAHGLSGVEVHEFAVQWQAHHGETPEVAAALEAAHHRLPAFQPNDGHVVIALQNAFYQARRAANLAEGVVATVMGGGDTDTNGAVAGALLGAIHGPGAVPPQWLRAVLTCRPEPRDPAASVNVACPRPHDYWPAAALHWAEALSAPVPPGAEAAPLRATSPRAPVPAPSPHDDPLQDRFRGALLGGALGDALGRHMEGRKPCAFLPNELDFLDELGAAKEHGTVTDDTQLTLCVAECLASCGHLDPRDLARRLVAWLPHGVGKGAATVAAVTRLTASEPWYVAGSDSAGNGSAMRSAPIGLLRYREPGLLRYEAMLSSLPTHRHPMALAGAVAMAAATAWLLGRSPGPWRPKDTEAFLAAVHEAIRDIETERVPERRDPACQTTLVDRIGLLPELLAFPEPDAVFARIYNGAFVLESLPAAFYCFLRTPDDISKALVTAVNAGYDADTVAAMAGTLAGALHGEGGLPIALLGRLEHAETLRGLADRLYGLAGRGWRGSAADPPPCDSHVFSLSGRSRALTLSEGRNDAVPGKGRASSTGPGAARQLLEMVACDLWTASHDRRLQIWTRQPENDVVSRLMWAQDPQTWDAFQLPEPMMGVGTVCNILVVGLNPGFDPKEDIPRAGWSLECYVDWYAKRFVSTLRDKAGRPIRKSDGHWKVVQHYLGVERLLPHGFRIGGGAVYADAIPWKSKTAPAFDNDVRTLATERVTMLLETLQPLLVITLGTTPASIFQQQPKATPDATPWCLGHWRGHGIAAYHPNAHVFHGKGSKTNYEQRVSQCATAFLALQSP